MVARISSSATGQHSPFAFNKEHFVNHKCWDHLCCLPWVIHSCNTGEQKYNLTGYPRTTVQHNIKFNITVYSTFLGLIQVFHIPHFEPEQHREGRKKSNSVFFGLSWELNPHGKVIMTNILHLEGLKLNTHTEPSVCVSVCGQTFGEERLSLTKLKLFLIHNNVELNQCPGNITVLQCNTVTTVECICDWFFQIGWKNASIQPDSIIKLLFHQSLHDQSWRSQGRHDEASKSDARDICKLTTEITSATVQATNEG